MRRVLLSLLCIIIFHTLQAQTGHLKFMGIPLDGTISQFQTKLILKGCKLETDLNKHIKGKPFRFFTGSFAGYESSIKIKFNAKTEIVWGAMVTIDFPNLEAAESKMKYYIDKLLAKYPSSSGKYTTKEGKRTYMLAVNDSKDFYGFIYLYTFPDTNPLEKKVYLIFNYKDYKNTDACEKNDLEDL